MAIEPAVLELAVPVVVLTTTIWVGLDAARRDWRGHVVADRPWKWVVGCLLLWILVFPGYLVARSFRPLRVAGSILERTALPRKPAIFWWGVVSLTVMAAGSVGPWVQVLGSSVGGTDGGGDGWIVLALAAVGFAAVLGEHRARTLGVLNLLIGSAGVAVTLYDRSDLAGTVASVGWGLNLALAGSASLAVHALVAVWQTDPRAASPPTPRTGALGYRPPFQTAPAHDGPAAPAPPEAPLPPAVALAAAGWYPDPTDDARLRYWTGDGWTERTAQIAAP